MPSTQGRSWSILNPSTCWGPNTLLFLSSFCQPVEHLTRASMPWAVGHGLSEDITKAAAHSGHSVPSSTCPSSPHRFNNCTFVPTSARSGHSHTAPRTHSSHLDRHVLSPGSTTPAKPQAWAPKGGGRSRKWGLLQGPEAPPGPEVEAET